MAEYPFYYTSNANYWSGAQTIGARGLQQFLTDASASASRTDDILEKWSLHDVGFASWAFADLSDGVYRGVARQSAPLGSHPISQSNPMPDFVGYHGKNNYKLYSAALVMNRTNPGIYVHSGLASNAANGRDADGNGVIDSKDDDWLKGYAAAAMAIEEARSHLMEPRASTQFVFGGGQFDTKPHVAGFSVTIVPGSYKAGDRKDQYGTLRSYLSVDLRAAMRSHFEPQSIAGPDGLQNYFLSVGDFQAYSRSGGAVEFLINTQLSGHQTGGTSTSLMEDLYWSTLAKLAGLVSSTLGGIVGAIPAIAQYFGPKVKTGTTSSGGIVYANGTSIDGDGDGWDTLAFYITVYFYRTDVVSYSFCAGMTSWIGYQGPTPWRIDNGIPIQLSEDLTFGVSW